MATRKRPTTGNGRRKENRAPQQELPSVDSFESLIRHVSDQVIVRLDQRSAEAKAMPTMEQAVQSNRPPIVGPVYPAMVANPISPVRPNIPEETKKMLTAKRANISKLREEVGKKIQQLESMDPTTAQYWDVLTDASYITDELIDQQQSLVRLITGQYGT